VSAAECRACRGDWPPAETLIADCGPANAYLYADQFFPGWTVLVLKRHATELWELARDERNALMDGVTEVSRALAAVYEAKKMNYELLGNALPHIHWHLVPRWDGDTNFMPAVADAKVLVQSLDALYDLLVAHLKG